MYVLTTHFDLDVLDLEAEDDGPHEPQDEARVAVGDVLSTNALQTHLLQMDEQKNKSQLKIPCHIKGFNAVIIMLMALFNNLVKTSLKYTWLYGLYVKCMF